MKRKNRVSYREDLLCSYAGIISMNKWFISDISYLKHKIHENLEIQYSTSVTFIHFHSKTYQIFPIEKKARRPILTQQSYSHNMFSSFSCSEEANIDSYVSLAKSRTDRIDTKTWIPFGQNPRVGIHGCLCNRIGRDMSRPAFGF